MDNEALINTDNAKFSKIEMWERKLLDLGLRNTLINMRLSRTVIPILTDTAASIEDLLADGEDFSVFPKPEDWHRSTENLTFDNIHELADKKDYILEEFKLGRLRSSLTPADLNDKLKNLHRKARTLMEENGANALYIALGLLRWYEFKKSGEPRFAPILLLPIEIIRKGAEKGYVIRKRDEDTQLNITLLEKLKQDFDIEIQGLSPLPGDEHGVDTAQVFKVISSAIKDKKGWDVLESACIGVFSFSQFVMWNDLKNRFEDLSDNKIVQSLIDGKLSYESAPLSFEDYEPDGEKLLLPMAVDGSQMFAVEESAKGKSFILHGPPGTGKSQTITVMIANALSEGKTVLFVAEKMAALEVVEKRLKSIGIGPFCLELHSNKAKKKEVLEQLNEALEVNRSKEPEEYKRKLSLLMDTKKELDRYAGELHVKREPGISLFDMISRYEDCKEACDIKLDELPELKDIDSVKLEDMDLAADRLISAGKAAGHPAGHKLKALGLREYAPGLKEEILELNKDYSVSLSKLKGFFNGSESLDVIEGEVRKEQKFIEAEGIRKDLEKRWKPDFFSLDAASLMYEYNTVNAKWFLPKYFGMKDLVKRFTPYSAAVLSKESLGNDLASFSEYRRLSGESGLTEAKGLVPVWNECEASREKLYTKGVIKRENSENFFADEEELCGSIDSGADLLREWAGYNKAAEEAEKLGLKGLITAYETGLDHDKVKSSYNRALYKSMASSVIDGSEVLKSFSGPRFQDEVEQFKKLESEIRELSKQIIFCRLAANVPDAAQEAAKNSEIGALKRAIKSNGRGLSIRRLMDKIPTLLPRLCPCMLMSPISAAQYLDPGREPFDLVIFDEASQMPTSKAVGVLSRGKEAVIVGDPKQMPPTTFFTSDQTDEEDPEYEDMESILDDCLALNMPETRLKWHYRSRHESLIAFSNHEFYESRLYTFPSVNDRESKVTLTHIEGVFERAGKRQNKAEAAAVVEEVKRRFNDPEQKEMSYGIVTFNVNQQDLIEDLLNEECVGNEEFESWLYNREEGIFIKNLENVQGDERDVILFSVGYGPDESGKVYMNFGPLNRDGGWRRLNVAVTRARKEMKVFSSLSSEDIDLGRTKAEGVIALKNFLDFAAGKRNMFEDAGEASKEEEGSGIAASIRDYLKTQGYEAVISVGSSEFTVDIGVIDPENSSRYILGILLDGDSYKAAKTTADREVSQISVLQGLGWRIKRIWTMDWYDDPERELRNIMEVLHESTKRP